MENLVFSLNVVLPVFFMILIGAILAKADILNQAVCGKILKLVFYVSLPASMFQNVANSDLRETVNVKFTLYALGSTIVIFFLGWGLSLLFLKNEKQIAAAAHAAFRGNFVYIGLAICQNLVGKENVPSTVMVIAFIAPLYNVLAVVLLSHYDKSAGETGVWKELIKILKNPMILSIAAAIPFSLMRIHIVQPAAKTISYLAQIASPMALLLIGASLNLSSLKAGWKGISLAALVKIVLAPLLGSFAAFLLGFRGEELAVLYTMHAVPSAANSYIMTRQMHADAELGAGAVMASSLLSVITMTAGIWWLRSLGLV